MNEQAFQNGFGMFINAFLVGLVASVIPAMIAGIDTSAGIINIAWNIVTASVLFNVLIALGLGINEYIRATKIPVKLRRLSERRPKGFLPY